MGLAGYFNQKYKANKKAGKTIKKPEYNQPTKEERIRQINQDYFDGKISSKQKMDAYKKEFNTQ